jgi:hypothetical protein
MPFGEENQVDQEAYYQIIESLSTPGTSLPDNININFYRPVPFQKNPAEEEIISGHGEDIT